MKFRLLLASLTAIAAAAVTLGQTPPAAKPLDVARFSADGKLLKPTDLASWVFLGTSLGMGYNPGSFNAANPGQFQVVLMEPTAYRYFTENKRYAPGSMFLLSFYNPDQRRSINQRGFVQADLTNYEIHLVDPGRGKDGRAFFTFNPDDAVGNALPPGNNCVQCHNRHGAFDGTFAQFYPTIRHQIPKEALERALKAPEIQ